MATSSAAKALDTDLLTHILGEEAETLDLGTEAAKLMVSGTSGTNLEDQLNQVLSKASEEILTQIATSFFGV